MQKTHVLAVPELDGPVTTGGVDDTLSAPAHSIDTRRVASERELELAELRVPDADGAVLGGRSNARAVRVTENGERVSFEPVILVVGENEQVDRLPGERRDPLLVSAEGLANRFARLGVPEPDLSRSKTLEESGKVFWSRPRQTVLSMLPVATMRSMPSHSTHSNHPVWPARVDWGVSVSRFHKRQVLSPDPVARSFPVGENEAQRMGEA